MTSVPKSDQTRVISFSAKGELLIQIQAYADQVAEPLGRATLALAKVGLEALAAQDTPTPTPSTITVDLRTIGAEELFDELRERVLAEAARGDLLADLQEANQARDAQRTRAERAEGQLALIGGVLSGHVQPAGEAA